MIGGVLAGDLIGVGRLVVAAIRCGRGTVRFD